MPEVIGWTPDVGHIANGGMEPLEIMQQYAELINHLHYKDWDGQPEFAVMGEGKIDFVGITRWLRDRGFTGWIVCEDEGHRAIDDPDAVTLADGAYVRKHLQPLLTGENPMTLVASNGIQMYYEERGAGDPLLLIMGITARGAVWEKHAEYWARDFRCILPDNRGVGLSDKPAGPYTSARWPTTTPGCWPPWGSARSAWSAARWAASSRSSLPCAIRSSCKVPC